jgi:nucleoside triphosphatase
MSRRKLEPVVNALIFNSKKEVFLMKSPKWKNKWMLPGGHVNFGETIEQAVKREMKEETGLNVYDIKSTGFHDFIFNKAFKRKSHMIVFSFSCKTKSKKVKVNHEVKEYVWIPFNKISKLKIESYVKIAIKNYKNSIKKCKF